MARRPLYERLPEIWKRLDPDGVVQRYLGVLDAGFDRSHGLAKAVLDFRSVDRVPDRYLALLGDIVGHQWRPGKSHDWNRSRIRDAIRRHSYKGTVECIQDLCREHGSDICEITDQASRLLVLDMQGELSEDAAHFESPDYWQDGAFVLRVSPETDLDGLKADLAEVLPAGTRWYLYVLYSRTLATETAGTSEIRGRIETANVHEFALDVAKIDENLFLGHYPAGSSVLPERDMLERPIVFGGHLFMNSVGIRMDETQITMDMGSGSYPLPRPFAFRRGASEIA